MASRIRSLIVAWFLVAAIVPTAAAQTGGVLSGVVYDSAGKPVPGVVLTIVDPEQQGTRVVLTDERGGYFVDRLDYGTAYAVHVSHRHFRKSRLEATANEGESAIDITLDRQRSRLARLGSFLSRVLRLGFMRQTGTM